MAELDGQLTAAQRTTLYGVVERYEALAASASRTS